MCSLLTAIRMVAVAVDCSVSRSVIQLLAWDIVTCV